MAKSLFFKQHTSGMSGTLNSVLKLDSAVVLDGIVSSNCCIVHWTVYHTIYIKISFHIFIIVYAKNREIELLLPLDVI